MKEDTLELFHSQDILIDTKTHGDAIDALLDVHMANSRRFDRNGGNILCG